LRRYKNELILVVANLSRFVQHAELDLRAYAGAVPEEMFGRSRFPAVTEAPYPLTLGPHGFYWFALGPGARTESTGDSTLLLPILTADGLDLSAGTNREDLEAVLPAYLGARHPGLRSEIAGVRIEEIAPLRVPPVEGIALVL